MAKVLVKKSTYVNFFYEEENQLITAVWLPSTENLYEDNDYKAACILTAEICEKYKPKSWLADNRTLFYTIVPDIQTWIDKELTPRFEQAGLQKMAFILVAPEEPNKYVFENISVRQLIEEENTKEAWQNQFFSTEEEARKWLLT